MNELMTKWFGQSWRTTIGGILLGAPTAIMGAVLAAGYTAPKWLVLITTLLTSAGGMIVGGFAKDAKVHSVQAEVAASTIENPSVQATAVVEAKQAAAVAAIPVPVVPVPASKP